MQTDTPAPSLPTALTASPHAFLQPTPALHASLLQLAKRYLDPLAADVADVQQRRQTEARRSRKRKRRGRKAGDADREEEEEVLRMKRVHVEGFEVQQVWEQARRVLDAAADEVGRAVPVGELEGTESDGDGELNEERQGEMDELEEEDSLGEEGVDWEYEGDDVGNGDSDVDMEEVQGVEDENLSEDEDLRDSEDEEAEFKSEDERGSGTGTFVKDRLGLNDGFFSIDDFNRETQFLERQDAKGDPDDGAASDEEDVDWTIDPFLQQPQPILAPTKKISRKSKVESESEDEDGPTFGNMDLNAPEGASEDEAEDGDEDVDMEVDGFSNANNIFYRDFFAPPPKDPSKKQRQRRERDANVFGGDGMTGKDNLAREPGDEEDDIQRTMSAVHRDLFEDEASEEEEADSSLLTDQHNANLSSHERAQLALRAEIRRLEAANVAEKPWTLTGETVAQARPMNSLLEEDLDFERVGKPVPVVTDEVHESIEALIKRRILSRDFDELTRRRPDDLITGGVDPRRGRTQDERQLADSKPQRGLAEEYEQDHLRRTDPNYVDARSEALKKSHQQIEAQWAAVSAQLDALTNWHYKPRPPAPSLDVRTDAPTIRMEDARPAAGGDVGGSSGLAPQEVYRPGDEGRKGHEVLTSGGTAMAKEEETRESKRRRRRRDKERAKKAAGNKPAVGAGVNGEGKAAEKENVVGQLKKGGVGIIDKKGAVRDVDGKARHHQRQQSVKAGGGSFIL